MAILSANHVCFSYQGKHQTVYAVRGITCDFHSGTVYSIVGKSGSGKSTFLSLLAGLELPDEGDILIEGVSIRKGNRDLLRRDKIAVIYQNYNLFPLLTVEENVMYPLKLKGIKTASAKKEAERCLREVGLDEGLWKRFPLRLSGGEQQRVAIARALATGAKILLADEPTGNLDTENSRTIVSILQKLAHDNGCCVIIVTHDLQIAEASDVVMNMKDGILITDCEKDNNIG